jgi:hypothetical protein
MQAVYHPDWRFQFGKEKKARDHLLSIKPYMDFVIWNDGNIPFPLFKVLFLDS